MILRYSADSLLGRGQEYCGQWGGKGDKRGLCALVGRECPSLLEFPWCYLCLRLMVKLTGLLIDFAVSGPWDQPHRIWFRAVNCMVWLLYSWWGQKVAGINGATLLLNCQVNSVTLYFTDLTINGNNEQNSLCLPNCVKGSVSPPWSQICLEECFSGGWRHITGCMQTSLAYESIPAFLRNISVSGRNKKLFILPVSGETQVPPLV